MLTIVQKIKKNAFYFLLTTFYLLIPARGLAMCPVCTVGVAAGLGLSRWLGIDDTVSGIWIGALLASMTGWTINWLNNKKIKFYGRKILVAFLYYGVAVGPLYWKELIGHPFNKLWNIDKLMLGIAFGTIVFTASVILYEFLKRKNGGHAHFPYEKIVMPISFLVIASTLFYFITKQ